MERQAKFHTIVYGEEVPQVGSQFHKEDCLIVCQLEQSGNQVKMLYADGNGKVVEHVKEKDIKIYLLSDDFTLTEDEKTKLKQKLGIEDAKEDKPLLLNALWSKRGAVFSTNNINERFGDVDMSQVVHDLRRYKKIEIIYKDERSQQEYVFDNILPQGMLGDRFISRSTNPEANNIGFENQRLYIKLYE